MNEAMLCAYEKFFDLLFTPRRLRRRGMRLSQQVFPAMAGKFFLSYQELVTKRKMGRASLHFVALGPTPPGPSRREEGAGTAAGKRGRAGDGERAGRAHTIPRPVSHT